MNCLSSKKNYCCFDWLYLRETKNIKTHISNQYIGDAHILFYYYYRNEIIIHKCEMWNNYRIRKIIIKKGGKIHTDGYRFFPRFLFLKVEKIINVIISLHFTISKDTILIIIISFLDKNAKLSIIDFFF